MVVREVDWQQLLGGYIAQVDWPGASFWREISTANPDALVLLSVREPDAWYRSAWNTIFQVFDTADRARAVVREGPQDVHGALLR
jgi:Sulfotransferase domain